MASGVTWVGGECSGVAALAGGGQELCKMDKKINILLYDFMLF
jgi:hypothetical protein